MSIDKQARDVSRYDLVSGYMQRWTDGEFVYHSDYLELLGELEAAEKRIAELEAREVKVKQFSEFQICHYGGSEDYAKGYIDCQKNYNKALGAANILVRINVEG